jgi:hypothetical protein
LALLLAVGLSWLTGRAAEASVLDAGASLLERAPDWRRLWPGHARFPTMPPPCFRGAEDVAQSVDVLLRDGLGLSYESPLDGSGGKFRSACTRWNASARFSGEQLDIDDLEKSMRRLRLKASLSYHIDYHGFSHRWSIVPGVLVDGRYGRLPGILSWLDLRVDTGLALRFESVTLLEDPADPDFKVHLTLTF